MTNISRFTALAAAVLLAAPAQAQDGTESAMSRTPANAQRFLAAMPPQGFSAGAISYMLDGEVASTDVCVTALTGKVAAVNAQGLFVVKDKEQVPQAGFGVRLSGVTVDDVTDGSNAKRGGIRKGDIIRSINGTDVPNFNSVLYLLGKRLEQGNGITRVVVEREGQLRALDIEVNFTGQYIDVPIVVPDPVRHLVDWSRVRAVSATDGSPHFWVTLQTPDDEAAQQYSLRYSVKESRDRVLAAAQYLQQACDRTQELGF